MYRAFGVLFLSLLFSTISLAQKGTHTPYSIFGVGELRLNEYAAFLSMGGVSMANNDSTMVNPSNPAMYSYIGRYRPILQVGMNGRFSNFSTTTSETTQRNFGLDQFQLGIPIKKNWGAGLGLKPYSFTGYFISNYTVEDGDSTELFTNEGRGGINKFYVGVAYRPLNFGHSKRRAKQLWDTTAAYMDTITVSKYHRLSIGANANYLFGSSDRIRSFQYASSSQGLNGKVENSLRVSDVMFDFGLNYELSWKKVSDDGTFEKGSSFALGASYSPSRNLRSFQDLYSYSYINIGGFNGSEILSDTIEFVNNNQGSITIPESYKAGLEFRFGPKGQKNSSIVRVGADVRYQKWSGYSENFGSTFVNQLKDRTQMGLGIEWTPVTVYNPRTPFLAKAHYRIGFNYTMTELQFETSPNNYTGLTSYGMSFGVGLPITIIKNSNTNINFGANLGNMGTTDNGLIKEQYLGLFFGISITPGNGDLWFLKRKYD